MHGTGGSSLWFQPLADYNKLQHDEKLSETRKSYCSQANNSESMQMEANGLSTILSTGLQIAKLKRMQLTNILPDQLHTKFG